jgi:hypothetical protein
MLTHDGKLRVVKILDFGLAKATREEKLDSGLTGEGQALGTPDYIAPEQILRPSAADIRADIYSLGCTLYYLLTGHPPFQADTLYDVYQAHMSQNADPLNLVRPEVPTELAAIAAKMMAKEPTRRFQTPVDVAQALTPFFKKGAVPFNSAGAEVSRVPPTTVDGAGPGATSATTLLGTDGAGPDLRTPGKTTPASPEARGESPKEFQEKVSSPDVAAPVARVRRPRSTWMWPVSAAGVIALVLCTVWLAGILRLKTPQGMLVVENIPESTELFVDGGKVALQIPGAARMEITVPAGKHGVEVRRGAVTLYGEQVTVAEGGRTPVVVRFERGTAEAGAPLAGQPIRTHAAGDAPAAPKPSATAATSRAVVAAQRIDAQSDKPPPPEARPKVANATIPSAHETDADEPSSLADESTPIQPPRIVATKSVIKLPGIVGDVAVGAAGRYLFLVLRRSKKIAVFDVNAAAIVKSLPIASDEVLVAAGSEMLVLVYPDQKVVQRWSLDTFEKGLTKPFPIRGVIKAIAMGSNSKGPLLVHWAVGSSALDKGVTSLLDMSSLKPVTGLRNAGPQQNNDPKLAGTGAIAINSMMGSSYRDLIHLRAAASGDMFGMWCTSHSPSGLCTVVLRGKTVESYYDHNSVGHVVPGPDGRFLYTGSGGIYDQEVKAQQRGMSEGIALFPSNDPLYYLGIAGLPHQNPRPVGKEAAAGAPRAAVYLPGQSSPLLELGNLKELEGLKLEDWAKDDFTLDKRVHYVPAANLLVTIPPTNNELVLRPVNVVGTLRKSGAPYLFVASQPPRTAFRRQKYRFQLEVQSDRTGFNYTLDSGPAGMEISPEGTGTWQVPADFDEDDPEVIITVTNAAGREAMLSYKLRVR